MSFASNTLQSDTEFALSIVIPCLNERTHIESTINSLLHGTINQVEVIVVDGGSSDGTAELLRGISEREPKLVVLHNPRRITPVSLNIGIKAARGEFVAILGAHSEPAADWAEKNLQTLRRHPDAIAVGGVLTTISETAVGGTIAAVLSSRFGVGNSRFRIGGQAGFVDTVVFGCYRRRAFEYGLFDEQLATNQDDEFNIRLTARGEKMYFDPAIQCRYYCRPKWGKLVRQYWRYGRFKVLVFKKAGKVGSMRQLIPAIWTAFLAISIAAFPFSAAVRVLLASVLALYVALGSLAAALSIKQLRWRTAWFVPVAATVHLVYGAGLCCGFVIDGLLAAPALAWASRFSRLMIREQQS